MNRKKFIGSVLPLAITWESLFSKPLNFTADGDESKTLLPDFLIKGDKIGICSPAGFISREGIEPAINKLTEWGFIPMVGASIGKKDFTFGGTDEERRKDFQSMLDDPGLKAILCARGGYGIVRIIDQLNFEKFRKYPKWVIGFSDVTVLHCHINHQLRIASVHSKMTNSFPAEKSKPEPEQIASIDSIRDCLLGNLSSVEWNGSNYNKSGNTIGELVGGNLRIIENMMGTPSELHTHGKILFLEDTEEYLYNIDRMFWNLKRSGKLSHLKGLILGGFKIKPDDPGEEFGLSLEQIVLEKIKEYDYPVGFHFPVGHQKHSMALICGGNYEMVVQKEGSRLTYLKG